MERPDLHAARGPGRIGFVDSGGDVHLVNEGSVDLVMVVASLVPADAARRIDVPSPGDLPLLSVQHRRNARVSDLAIAKVRRFCDQRVPAEARNQVCLEVTTRAASITIVERRPLWEGGPGAWTRMPIAQLRHDTAAGTWALFWVDRSRRWHRYDHLDPTPQLDDLLKEVDEDPFSMFWG